MLCASARYQWLAMGLTPGATHMSRFGLVCRCGGAAYSMTSFSAQTDAKTEPTYHPSQSRQRAWPRRRDEYSSTKRHIAACCMWRATDRLDALRRQLRNSGGGWPREPSAKLTPERAREPPAVNGSLRFRTRSRRRPTSCMSWALAASARLWSPRPRHAQQRRSPILLSVPQSGQAPRKHQSVTVTVVTPTTAPWSRLTSAALKRVWSRPNPPLLDIDCVLSVSPS